MRREAEAKIDDGQERINAMALGIEGLWDEIQGRLDLLEDEKDRAFAKAALGWHGDELHLEHPDGRAIVVKRVRERIVLEPKSKSEFDRKTQARLRRSFVETRPDLLAKEIVRQLELLLAAYTPLWASSGEQKAKADAEKKIRHKRALELAGTLRGSGDGAVDEPDPEEDHDYYVGKVKALLPDPEPDLRPIEVSLQVQERGVHIAFEGNVSPAVAAAVAEALSPYLAPRVACERKRCKERNLMDHDERTQKRCHQHRKPEVV